MARATNMISLAEAADRLGVHYMTAYRYVRTGKLDAVKVGHEWQVAEADVDALRAPAEQPASARRGRRVDYPRRIIDRLLGNDEAGAWALIEQALVGGMTPEQIHTEVLGPALVEIGDRWANGRLTIAEEHQASAITMRLIGRLGPRFRRKGRSRGTVITGAPPGELHGIPTAMASDLIRSRGFTVIDLGADVPTESWVSTAQAADRLVAVTICATSDGNEDAVARTVRALRDAVAAPVLLGGRAVADAEHALRLGASEHTASLDDVLAAIERLTAA